MENSINPLEELKKLAKETFKIESNHVLTLEQLDDEKKSVALKKICHGKYSEQEIAYMQVTDNLSSGFALTINTLCTGGKIGDKIRLYKEINTDNCANIAFLLWRNGDLQYIHELDLDISKLLEILRIAKNF